MTFGRPSGIPDDYVKLELPKELVNEDTDALQPFSSASGSLLSAQFFVATMYVVFLFILRSNILLTKTEIFIRSCGPYWIPCTIKIWVAMSNRKPRMLFAES